MHEHPEAYSFCGMYHALLIWSIVLCGHVTVCMDPADNLSMAIADLHNAAALHYIEKRVFSRAETEALKAIELLPEKAELAYNLGVILSSSKRNLEAQHAYARALTLQEDFPSAHFNLARTYMTLANSLNESLGGVYHNATLRVQHLQSALKHLQMSIEERGGGGEINLSAAEQEIGGKNAEVFKSMEEVLYQLGDSNGSWAVYNSLLAVAPHQGLRAKKPEHCGIGSGGGLMNWLADRLLELTSLAGGRRAGIYPRVPWYVRSD